MWLGNRSSKRDLFNYLNKIIIEITFLPTMTYLLLYGLIYSLYLLFVTFLFTRENENYWRGEYEGKTGLILAIHVEAVSSETKVPRTLTILSWNDNKTKNILGRVFVNDFQWVCPICVCYQFIEVKKMLKNEHICLHIISFGWAPSFFIYRCFSFLCCKWFIMASLALFNVRAHHLLLCMWILSTFIYNLAEGLWGRQVSGRPITRTIIIKWPSVSDSKQAHFQYFQWC